MVWRIFSWHTFGPLVQSEHLLYATVYLSIATDHIHLFMTVVYHLLNDDYFMQDNVPYHKAPIISNCFFEYNTEITVLKRPLQSSE